VKGRGYGEFHYKQKQVEVSPPGGELDLLRFTDLNLLNAPIWEDGIYAVDWVR
jgi:hypothetical protein